MGQLSQTIARELSVRESQVTAAVQLLDDGATVPFIARYRKEVTGSLDDTQLRHLEERLRYLRELEERRSSILKSIREQEKLTPVLEQNILAADTKSRLEDLYLPYKPKRRTKAQIAREAGLEPLAKILFDKPEISPEIEAEKYLNPDKGIADVKAALDGAKQILMEQFSEDAELIAKLRGYLQTHGLVCAVVFEDKKQAGDKFRDYFDFSEKLTKIPSHRALAIFRGRNEGILNIRLDVEGYDASSTEAHPCERIIASHNNISHQNRAADNWLEEVTRWTWRITMGLHLETELLGQLREQAEEEAIVVFTRNIKELLMAAPAGPRTIIGLDPGLRTGVKVTVIDGTGQLLSEATIYPHAPKNQWDVSISQLQKMCAAHAVSLIAIGNGTASRETDKLAGELISKHPELQLQKVIVSEAGASVYSASAYAASEFPDLDVSLRGAVSIARRLQDPLAELVKIDPKAIGVGQYQHDVNQVQLSRSLEAVVEDCVNQVGVDINTASSPLLARISGLNSTIATNIVQYRDENGPFKNRKVLKKVARLGAKTYEQCAGFMRITDGENPLDASSVHPESYPVVEKMAASSQREIKALIGDGTFLKQLNAADFTDDTFGLPTVVDILAELEKPGRDPRPEFRAAKFKEGVEKLSDLKAEMMLEGVVTNVTNFGAFVDVGVHQDGLVHISMLADRFVKNPHDVVKPGDIVKVKVLEVDVARKRIGLSMKSGAPVSQQQTQNKKSGEATRPVSKKKQKPSQKNQKSNSKPDENNPFAIAFAKAKKD